MKTSAPTQAGIDRLHEAMAARVENGSLPGIMTLVAQGDDVYVDMSGRVLRLRPSKVGESSLPSWRSRLGLRQLATQETKNVGLHHAGGTATSDEPL